MNNKTDTTSPSYQTVDEPAEETYKTPLTLKRVPIDDGGYAPNGTYFGCTDDNLYRLASEDGKIDRVFRAKNDHAAIAYASKLYTHAKIPTKVEGLKVKIGEVELDAFTRQYLNTALWFSSDTGDEPLHRNYEVGDIAVATLQEAKRECEDFQEAQRELLEQAYQTPGYDEESAGHDFWLTRNGHGTGFWDRGLGEVGDKLSEVCKPYGSVDLYVGDDGKIHR